MGNRSNLFFIGNVAINRRNFLKYSLPFSLAACSWDCHDPIGPDTKPQISVSAAPMQDVGTLVSNIGVTVTGKFDSLTVDYDGNGTISPDERFTQVPASRQITYQHDGSNNTNQKTIIAKAYLNDDADTKSVILTINPAANPTINLSATPTQGTGKIDTRVTGTAAASRNRTLDWVGYDANFNGTVDSSERKSLSGVVSASIDDVISTENNSDIVQKDTLLYILMQSDGKTTEFRIPRQINPYNKISGTIFAIDSNGNLSPLAGALVSAGGATAVSDNNGDYLIKAVNQIGKINLSKSSFQPYSTYSGHTIEQGKQSFALIPGNIIDDVNDMLRRKYNPDQDVPMERWGSQPTYYIVTPGYMNVEYGEGRIRFLKKWLMSDRIEKMTNGKLKRAARIEDIVETDNMPSGAGLDGKWVFNHSGAGGVSEMRYDTSNPRIIKGVVVNTSATDTIPEREYTTTHESGHGVGLHHPKQGTEEYNKSFMGIGAGDSAFTPATLRNVKILYDRLRPAGSMAPDNDPNPISGSSIMQSNISSSRVLKANRMNTNYSAGSNYNRRNYPRR